MYTFATTPEQSHVINLMLNERNLLKHFIHYYKDRAKKLIQNSDKLIYPPDRFYELTHENNFYLSKIVAPDLNKMPLKKICIAKENGDIYISKREFDCWQYLVQNYSWKEIGKILEISPRTVETYIANLKLKLACDKAEGLRDIAAQLKIF